MRMYQFKTGSGDVIDLDKVSAVYDLDYLQNVEIPDDIWWRKNKFVVKKHTSYHMILDRGQLELDKEGFDELKQALMEAK